MREKPVIQKIIASLLLLLFCLGATPKAFFHDLVADHKDQPSCNLHHASTVVHKQVINCHFDDLVVSSPLVLQEEPSISPDNLYPGENSTGFEFSYSFTHQQHKESRGPPSL